MWKITKVYTAFLFIGHVFWKERFEDRKIGTIFKLLFKENNSQFS